MARILPFRGFRYNPEKVGEIEKCLSPPYDVISPQEQNTLYATSPYNIVRVILGKDYPGDTPQRNKYTRAKEYFEAWTREGIIIRDAQAGFYVYTQEFEGKRRLGFFARVRLRDYTQREILPHEETSLPPKQTRAKLLRACKAHFGPIWGLYPDEKGEVEKLLQNGKELFSSFTTPDGVSHQLSVIENKEIIKIIREKLAPQKIIIADGHHRYEVALEYQKWFQKRYPQNTRSAYNYVMMYLVNLYNKALQIHPTYIIAANISNQTQKAFLNHLKETFKMETIPQKALLKKLTLLKESHFCFGIMNQQKSYFLSIKKEDFLRSHPLQPPLETLDCFILRKFLLNKLSPSPQFIYSKSLKDTFSLLQGEDRIAFFYNPPSLKELWEVVKKDLKMPPKSTFFYPKPLTGLVIDRII
jgi:uncharacterized protein (DUF1015 family)